MELIYGYNRKTYWRDTVYTEDTKYYASVDDLKRALSSLKKDHTAAVKFTRDEFTRDEIGYSICWESFERGIITFNAWKTNNHQWIECSYETARKRAIQLFKGEISGRELFKGL